MAQVRPLRSLTACDGARINSWRRTTAIVSMTNLTSRFSSKSWRSRRSLVWEISLASCCPLSFSFSSSVRGGSAPLAPT